MTTIVFGTVLPWLLIGLGTWLGFQLVRQNGRLLLRLETIEKQLAPRAGAKPREAGGLPIGMAAPDFELPDLAGVRHKLSDFRDRNVLLIFFNPQCRYCTKMAPDLAALPEGGGDRPVLVVVSTGDARENRKLVEKYGIRCLVLLQQEMEIASTFRAQGTPMGYQIDKAGRIASELTVGAEPLLQLTATIMADQNAAAVPENGLAPGVGKGDPSLARSRLNRNGLQAGTIAPEFQLPRLDGGELSLADLRGGRVLLVFSDPDCGPCDELAPRLQEIHLRRPDLQVLVVSRRDVEANRAKVAALGLTFPIVLQRQWEISLLYAKFATPVGYLIDEQGILASDVAVGVGPILALVDEAVHESHHDAESLLPKKEYASANGK
jgi:peroxiredoxin